MKLSIDFPELDRDDKPVFDWNSIPEPHRPKFWRHVDPPTLSRREVAKCGLIGLGLLVCVFGAIVVMFCAL